MHFGCHQHYSIFSFSSETENNIKQHFNDSHNCICIWIQLLFYRSFSLTYSLTLLLFLYRSFCLEAMHFCLMLFSAIYHIKNGVCINIQLQSAAHNNGISSSSSSSIKNRKNPNNKGK